MTLRGTPAPNLIAHLLAEVERLKAALARISDGRETLVMAPSFGGGSSPPPFTAIHAILGDRHTNALRVVPGTGLSASYEAGRVRLGDTVYDISAGTLSLTASATNYVYVGSGGTVQVSTSGFPAGSIPLAVLVTDSSQVISTTDKRAIFISPPPLPHELWSSVHGDVDTADARNDGDVLTWDATAQKWKAAPPPGAGTGAPTNAEYITYASNTTLTNEKVLGADIVLRGTASARPAAGLAGRLYFATDEGVLYRDNGTAWEVYSDALHAMTWNFTGADLTVTTGTVRLRPPRGGTILYVRCSAGTAPAGQDIIVDINRGGTTIFTTQANRPKVPAGSNDGSSAVPDVTSFNAGDVFTCDIDQVGSTTAGKDLVVTMFWVAV